VIDVPSGRETEGGFVYPERIETLDSGQRGIGIRSDLRFMVVRTTSGKWQSWELGPAGIIRVVALEDAPGGVGWIRFSPAGDIAAIIANDNLHQVRFWDLRTGKPFGHPCASEASILTSNWMPGAFSSDGRHFAAGMGNGTVHVWDVATGAVVFALGPMRDARIRMVEYSPDGSRIVTANDWGEAQLWNAATGQAASPVITHGAAITTVAFSSDGKLLLTGSGDGTARIWHTSDGSPAGQPILPEPGAGVRFARFDSSSSRIATASAGLTARVWDVRTGQPLTEPMTHPVRLFSAIFSPDGRFLRTETVLAPSMPTTFWLWSIPPSLPANTTTPEWLLQLATICATKVIDDAGNCVDAPDSLEKIDGVRRSIAALPADAPLADWGRWILDDRPDRSIAPGFTITPAEAAVLKARFAGENP